MLGPQECHTISNHKMDGGGEREKESEKSTNELKILKVDMTLLFSTSGHHDENHSNSNPNFYSMHMVG